MSCGAETQVGQSVVFLDANGYDGDRLQAAQAGIVQGQILVVEHVRVSSWSTSLSFFGYPNKSFNSVMFGLVEVGEFNFDLERMKKAVEGPSIRLPRGLTREQMREFIENSVKK